MRSSEYATESRWIREVFDVPAHVPIPQGIGVGISATIDNDATFGEYDDGEWSGPTEKWEVPEGDERFRCSQDAEPTENEWTSEGPDLVQTCVNYWGDVAGAMAWCRLNLLDDPSCWSAQNMGFFDYDGIHPCAHAEDLHPMDWNVGGYTPVWMANATLYLI